ncbi:MAG: hypothetical protein QM736_14275 [Vicinamibacterales bacterium]
MQSSAAMKVTDHSRELDFDDVRRRIEAIFIGSVGNLVEWYDFYAYAAFALYFAERVLPRQRSGRAAVERCHPVRHRLHRAAAWAAGCSDISRTPTAAATR